MARAAIEKRMGPRRAVRKACRELSKESGIPASTLRNWYHDTDSKRKVVGNTTTEPPKITTETQIKGVITRLKAATTIVESLTTKGGRDEMPLRIA